MTPDLPACKLTLKRKRILRKENDLNIPTTIALRNVRNRKAWAVSVVLLAMIVISVACSNIGPTETRDDSFSVGASPSLEVDGFNGSVVVNKGVSGTIRVQATLKGVDKIEYSVVQNGDKVTVVAEQEAGFNVNFGESPSAKIEITAPSNTQIDLRTSNGRIEAHGFEQSGAAKTSNGRIVLENVKGDFKAETSNGSIEIEGFEGAADLKTSNGSITFSGVLTQGSENRMRTSNGNINVTLEGTPSVELDASTSNGSVTSDLPITTTGRVDENHLVGTIGNGDAELSIDTSNGSIRVQ